jgi:FixJ family two-component response regulator
MNPLVAQESSQIMGSPILRLDPSASLACGATPSAPLVCVLDDEESIQRGISRLLRSGGLLVETFSSAKDYLSRAPREGPSCLVLDVCLPDADGLELQRTLESREIQIVFLTGHGDIPMCARAMKSGAVDFLTKPVDGELLLSAVNRALERSSQIHTTRVERACARAMLATLTPREFEVMQKVIAGLLNKQIAAQLGAAEKTVKIHRGRVMEKMQVHSVADLVRIAEIAGVEPSWSG